MPSFRLLLFGAAGFHNRRVLKLMLRKTLPCFVQSSGRSTSRAVHPIAPVKPVGLIGVMGPLGPAAPIAPVPGPVTPVVPAAPSNIKILCIHKASLYGLR